MPRKRGKPVLNDSWRGLIDNAAAEAALEGALEDATNSRSIWGGKTVTRGGSATKLSLTDDAANAQNSVQSIVEYSQVGVIIASREDTPNEHRLHGYDGDLTTESFNVNTTWNASSARRPIMVEYREKIYFCDPLATPVADSPTATDRQQMGHCNSSGTVALISDDLGNGSNALCPRVIEQFAGVIFSAGDRDAGATDEYEPAILRHTRLSIAPETAGGFDDAAWAYVGQLGKAITGLKAGRKLLLVAKADELWRVFGSPLDNPGFQFSMDPVEGSSEFGVDTPHALTYMNGWFYGLGKNGPWRSDGINVQGLGGLLQDRWATVDGDLELSFVATHPDTTRQLVLFGIPFGTAGPTEVWVWDIVNEQWMSRWVPASSVEINGIAPVTSGTLPGPTGVPGTLSADTFTTVGFNVNFTPVDTNAVNELWVKKVDELGTSFTDDWTLHATYAASSGAQAETVTGLHDGSTYHWKMRAVRNEQNSSFTADQTDGTTAMQVPTLSANGIDDQTLLVAIRITTLTQNADIELERRTNVSHSSGQGAWGNIATFSDQDEGEALHHDDGVETSSAPTTSEWYDYRIRAASTGWGGGTPTAFSAITLAVRAGVPQPEP